VLQLEQLSNEKAKLHKEKVDLENQLEAEQVIAKGSRHGLSWLQPHKSSSSSSSSCASVHTLNHQGRSNAFVGSSGIGHVGRGTCSSASGTQSWQHNT
jgi:hypothetical protein